MKKILTYPNPVLRKKADPVEEIDDDLQCLIDDMIKTMHEAPGIGLAANQVGELKRVIVFESFNVEGERNPEVLINP